MDIETLMQRARDELKRVFGFSDFRPGQEKAIRRILSGGDLLAILPTGGGKSICYQIPALVGDGMTIVISPLISLMKDQVDQLRQLNIPAYALNSTVASDEARAILRAAHAGEVRLLYIAPERLDSDWSRTELQSLNAKRIVIDEAHCVSQWGHDFRPSYLTIAQFISGFAVRPTVAAFTATATQHVRNDIVNLLQLNAPEIINTGYDRANLEFSVVRIKKSLRTAWIRRFLQEHEGQSGIIYCSSRKDTEALSSELNALCYHAGMDDASRTRAQEDFINDLNPIICATNAFGMGIDKPDVRFVIHYHMPASVEAYWQEAGRAGRDGMPAECVLLGDGSDANFWTQMILRDECDEEEKRKRRQRLDAMSSYLHTHKCLRAYLVEYFGDQIDDCGVCSNCIRKADGQGETDITTQAQMILSAVKRCNERVGKVLLKRILIGSRDQRITQLGLDRQSTYGIMRDVSKDLVGDYIDELIAQGLLTLTDSQYPVLKLTKKSIPVLRGEQHVYAYANDDASQVAELKMEKSAAKARTRQGTSQYYGAPLFEHLRQLRMKIARSKGLPAFMVFGDATLADMARKVPRTREEFLRVSGVGEQKLKMYGDEFIRAICDFTDSQDSQSDKAAAKPNAPAKAVQPQQTPSTAPAASDRLLSDMILFMRTRKQDFLTEFPEYKVEDIDKFLDILRTRHD